MKLSSMNEDRLLAKLLRGFSFDEEVVLGPGDDCAAVAIPGTNRLALLKTDCIVEGVHFLASEKPERVGWKALCRAVSDIASMGGRPRHALVTVLTPPERDTAFWTAVYRGLRKAARRFGINLVGGETARAPVAAISVSLTGDILAYDLVTRSGGRPGDRLFVTGRLGGSLAGRHLDFLPRVEEGSWLAEKGFPSAMMDLSDGLGADLPRLAAASGCSFHLDLEAIPRTAGCGVTAAVSDGEDYELLCAVPDDLAPLLVREWKRRFPRVPLTDIGELLPAGQPATELPGGYDHFARSQPKSRRKKP